MRRIFHSLLIVLLFSTLLGCATTGTTSLTGTEEITMDSVDNYLGMDARYVDLRNFSDMFSGGYIAGFEVVPFFQYLEGRALVRNNGWEYSSADVVDAAILENIFGPKDSVIMLMCGSGTRAGYVKTALEDLGYTTVYNVGGIRDYAGENKIFGDGAYDGTTVLPEVVDMTNIDQYRARPGAKYVDLRNVEDKYVAGYIDGFEFVSFFEYLDDNALVRNNGWEFSAADIESTLILENVFGETDREIFLMCGSGTRAGYVKDALESIGYTTVYNVGGIRDYTGAYRVLGDEEFTLVLN